MSGKFTTIIFDLDGVLVDTAEHHYLAWKRLADELGIPFDREKNKRLKGVPRLESLLIILENHADESELDISELMDRKNGYYVDMINRLTPADLLPGVKELLIWLRERGFRTAIASSSKNAGNVIARLKIEGDIDVVVDGSQCERSKPEPDIFLSCAEKLGSEPSECIVVEDAQAGVDAARLAEMYTVGIDKDHSLKNADVVLASTTQIRDFILK